MDNRNDRAVRLLLNGQNKEMKNILNKVKNFQKIGIDGTPMVDSITVKYNNRPIELLRKKNPSNVRKLSQIHDQE